MEAVMHAPCSLAVALPLSPAITIPAFVKASTNQSGAVRACELAAGGIKAVVNEVKSTQLVGLRGPVDCVTGGVGFVGRGAPEGDDALALESNEKTNWGRGEGRQRSWSSHGGRTRVRTYFLSGESAVGPWRWWRRYDTPIAPSTCCSCGRGVGSIAVEAHTSDAVRTTRGKVATAAIGCRRFCYGSVQCVEPGRAHEERVFGRNGIGFARKCSRTSSAFITRKVASMGTHRKDCRHLCMVSNYHREPLSRSSLPVGYPAFDYFEERVCSRDPLVVCIGEFISEFLPTVRKSPYVVPEKYQSWSRHQLQPPYFAKAPGSPPGTVAVGVARLGGNAAFIGKFGDDPQGYELHDVLVCNNVETQGVVFEKSTKTQKAMVRLERDKDGALKMPCVWPSADMALTPEEVDVSLLEKAEIIHVASLSLTSEKSRSSVLYAIDKAMEVKANISFDVSLPLPLWRSPRTARECIAPVWEKANFIKITDAELEFLLSDIGKGCKKVHSSSMLNEPTRWDEYQYNPDDLSPLLQENIKLLVVMDGTFWLHYFTPTFNGCMAGYEDALGPDRSGCGDAFWAGVLTLLARDPTLWRSEEKVREALKFGVACSLISHTTYGIIRGLPTGSAATNMAKRI